MHCPNLLTYLLAYHICLSFTIYVCVCVCACSRARVFVIDSESDVDQDTECLAAVRLLLLSADVTAPATGSVLATDTAATTTDASTLTCGIIRHCLLPVADVLLSAGTHIYLSTVKLHRAMLMMVILTTELGTVEG